MYLNLYFPHEQVACMYQCHGLKSYYLAETYVHCVLLCIALTMIAVNLLAKMNSNKYAC